MKPHIIAIVFVQICLSSTTLARVGETIAQLEIRYGAPVKTNPSGKPIKIENEYHFKGFTILAEIFNGNCLSEYIERLDGRPLDQEAVTLILSSYKPKVNFERYGSNRLDGLILYQDETFGTAAFDSREGNLLITHKLRDQWQKHFEGQRANNEVTGF